LKRSNISQLPVSLSAMKWRRGLGVRWCSGFKGRSSGHGSYKAHSIYDARLTLRSKPTKRTAAVCASTSHSTRNNPIVPCIPLLLNHNAATAFQHSRGPGPASGETFIICPNKIHCRFLASRLPYPGFGSLDRKDVVVCSRDFWFLARLRRRSRFENPVTEPKRSQKPKRPLFIEPTAHRYSFYGKAPEIQREFDEQTIVN
jgi:hypothetical protein